MDITVEIRHIAQPATPIIIPSISLPQQRPDDEFAVEANDNTRVVPQVHACACGVFEGYCNGTV